MNKQWVVYILECRDGTFYTGITNDLVRRLEAHNTAKGAKYTRGRGPVKLRYYEECADKPCALRREIEIKRMTHTQKDMLCTTCRKQGREI